MGKFFYVKQHDASDCAAACLASVSMYYGREITITKLRDVLGTDIKGTNVNGLVSGSKSLGFDAKAVRLNLDSLMTEKMTMPIIAHVITEYGYTHFVVIYRIKKDKLYINDPANNKKVITKEEFSKNYDGVIVLLKPNDEFVTGKIKGKNMFSRFVGLLKPHKRYFIWAIISSLILTLLMEAAATLVFGLVNSVAFFQGLRYYFSDNGFQSQKTSLLFFFDFYSVKRL